MKRLFALLSAATLAGVALQAQTLPLYEHFGANVYRVDRPQSAPPNIDATAVANYGSFTITNIINYDLYSFDSVFELPYEPGNMVYFTNKNWMSGLFGFRFNTATDAGRRRMGTFLNDNGAYITAVGGVIGEGVTVGQNFSTNLLFLANSYININATNLINRGALRSDNRGVIRLEGQNVDLTRGLVQVMPAQAIYDNYGSGCFNGGTKAWIGTNYWPDVGVSDLHWSSEPYNSEQQFNTRFMYVAIGGGYASATPVYKVDGLTPPPFFRRDFSFVLENPVGFVRTNIFDDGPPALPEEATNRMIQAVFVSNSDTNVVANVRFGPSSITTNIWTSPIVEFTAYQPDPLTAGLLTNRLYLMDYLMGETNNALQYAVPSGSVPTYCPGNYVVSRSAPCEWLASGPSNFPAIPAVFWAKEFSNQVVTNMQIAYAFRVTNVSVTVPPNASITNLGSRIEIVADNLKMDRTRLSSEGFVSVSTKHMVSSTNAVLEVEYLDLNLGSTNGNLSIRTLVSDSVKKFGGPVYVYSATWTNFTGFTKTNTETDPDTGEETNVITTNMVTLLYHVMLVDSHLSAYFPVNILSLRTTATNVDVGDNLIIRDNLYMDAESLTIASSGSLTIQNPIGSWVSTNTPNLRNLTNVGKITVTNVVNFGADSARPYANIINKGSIKGTGEKIFTENLENSGLISSVQVSTNALRSSTNYGPMSITAGTAKFDSGTIECGVDMHLSGNDIKFRNHLLQVGGTLFLNVTNSLADSGANAGNIITVGNGFRVERRAAGGNLLGTTLRTLTIPFAYVAHSWAGVDKGAVKEGFENNNAIGKLIIAAGNDSFIAFSGPDAKNAMYVDYLQLDGAASDYEATLGTDANFTIYFADSNISPETLDGKLGGRLRWVSSYAGANSAVDVVVGGKTVKMNRALRASLSIDSDGDGIANGFDTDPLTPSTGARLQALTLNSAKPPQAVLRWEASPSSVSSLEYTSVLPAAWQTLYKFTNDTVNGKAVEFVDPAPLTGARYYRLRVNQ